MLSIANHAHSAHRNNHINEPVHSSQYESPLEAIGNAMDTNSHLSKAREMIQGIYGKKKKKDNNFSIVEPRSEEVRPNGINPSSNMMH